MFRQWNISSRWSKFLSEKKFRTTANNTGTDARQSLLRTRSAIGGTFIANIDPCEDFYEYACGLLAEEIYTPDEKSSVDTVTLKSDMLSISLVKFGDKDLEI